MSDFVITKTIDSPYEMTEELVKETFKNILQNDFDRFEWDVNNSNNFKGRVKTAVFNPVVDLVGKIETRFSEVGGKTKIMITADAKVNGWFCFGVISSILLTFFSGPFGLIIGWGLFGWMWYSQRKKMLGALERACEQFDFKFSPIDANIYKDPIKKYKFCTKCGTKLSADAMFCFECGTQQ